MTSEPIDLDQPDRAHPTASAPIDPLQTGATWNRLQDQLKWYGTKSRNNKRAYMGMKVLQLVAAALVPVVASVHAAVWVTGGLGALVVVLEGIQQLGQFHANWINYRATAEELNHEKYLYLATSGPYEQAADPKRVLAGRIESLMATEHTKWTSGRQQVLSAERSAGGQTNKP
jgi:Protein of unknown function (DUF4231)